MFLILGWAAILPAQSPLPSQKGKHTLSFYPLHLTYLIWDYRSPSFTGFPALGYQYHFKDDWSVQTKLFYRQLKNPTRRGFESFVIEKNMKLGVQYYCVNRNWQLALGLSAYLEQRNFGARFLGEETFFWERDTEREGGLEFGLSAGYRINKNARLFLGMAVRYGKVREEQMDIYFYKRWLYNPLESFGFEYTF